MREHSTEAEQILERLLRGTIEDLVPDGMRIEVNDVPWIQVRLYCAGTDLEMAYYCSREPGHAGKCWSCTKSLDFTPVPLRRRP
jgi:hypothetical protein